MRKAATARRKTTDVRWTRRRKDEREAGHPEACRTGKVLPRQEKEQTTSHGRHWTLDIRYVTFLDTVVISVSLF